MAREELLYKTPFNFQLFLAQGRLKSYVISIYLLNFKGFLFHEFFLSSLELP